MEEIYKAARLSEVDIGIMQLVLADEDVEFYNTSAFEKLFEYFAFETGQMPYGIAKARTGEPDIWIIEYLESVLSHQGGA
jgi:hypothetical protein